LEELSRQLDFVQNERDQLRVQLEQLVPSTNGPTLSRGGNQLSPMPLRRKTRATVAASNHSHAAPTPYTERSDSFNSVASSQTNGHMPNDDVPVKPQRPSKAVISSRLMIANQSRSDPRPRTWSSNVFQNLFRGQN
jgi:hypothetical protein